MEFPGQDKNTGSIAGKTVLVTGSTDGLGKLVALHLAGQQAKVILHGRNREKGESVRQELINATQNSDISYFNGDFASLEDVKSLSEELLRRIDHLDILINNVGIGSGASTGNKRELSKEGYELRFIVNYLAHVLLTEKLLPLLTPGSGEIINVASVGQEPIDFSNLMLEKGYDGFLAYKRSKTALIMYTFDLADKLKDKQIRVNAVHPASLMNTKMVIEDWGYTWTTVEQGAEAVESLLFTTYTGQYFDGKKPAIAIKQAYDPGARQMLKEITAKIIQDATFL